MPITTSEYLTKVVEMSHTNPLLMATAAGFRGTYVEMAKLELKKRALPSEEFDIRALDRTLERIRMRQDMAEFPIPSLIRILKEYRDMLDAAVIKRIEDELVGFRYWIDEPGKIEACYFTENHQPLYHSAEILVGEMFPDTVFPSDGKTGAEHVKHGMTFMNRWLGWRARFGFSEWFTNYYSEDIISLLGLYHYAKDEALRERCKKMVDMLLFDIAVNTFEGHWSGCQGRTYVRYLVDPRCESISPICKLYWDEGDIDGGLADCAIMIAAFDYDCPEVIKAVGRDKSKVMINKERMSLNVRDAKTFGIDPADIDNIMLFWGIQAYSAREVIENSKKVVTPTNWMNERFNAFSENYALCDLAHIPTDDDPDFTAMTQADLYTYKTPDYILSCSQDFRKGKQGYQQHIWGAYMGGKARVFTNHMGSSEYDERPNFLAGNAYLPRAVQHENTIICIYRIPICYIQYFETHAYFPRHEFDEVVEKDDWVFGRRKNAYIALKSLSPAEWKAKDPNLFKTIYGDTAWREFYDKSDRYIYHCNGHANVWVTEMGSSAQNGSFENFMAGFDNAKIEGDTFKCTYHSPSQGNLGFGWNGDFTVNGKVVNIHDYPRYDNQFCKAAFDSTYLKISCGGKELFIDHNV